MRMNLEHVASGGETFIASLIMGRIRCRVKAASGGGSYGRGYVGDI